jgi:hypothetical protein
MHYVQSQRLYPSPRSPTMGRELGSWKQNNGASDTFEGSVAATNAATSLNGMHSLSNCEISGVLPPSSLPQRCS